MRWAILGSGSVAPSHALALDASPYADLIAVCDRHPERAEALAQRFGARAYGSVDELLDAEDLDAATVALPTVEHRSAVEALARRQIHALCEKPLSGSVADCEAMIAACRVSGVRLGVIHNNRGLAPSRWVAEHLTEGSIDLAAIGVVGRLPTRPSPHMTTGEMMSAIGVHYVDLLSWWLGVPRRICAVAAEGTVDAVFGFDGVTAHLSLAFAGPHSEGVRIEVVAKQGRMVYESRGVLHIDDELGEPPPADREIEGARYGPGHQVVIGAAARELAEGRVFPVSGEAGLQAVALCEAVTDSARTGQTVEWVVARTKEQ